MKHGDFTKLAKYYHNRPGYSLQVLKMILNYIGIDKKELRFADIGAGTGKLTENLVDLGLCGYSVEPNDTMREEGIKIFKTNNLVNWSKGTAENTGLPDSSVDWVLMGSSFHWTSSNDALREFKRILKPGGFFTAIWNPRDVEKSELSTRIEKIIYEMIPNLKRVSSGSSKNIDSIEDKLLSTDYFHNIIFCEAPHKVMMSVERYLGVWKSVNDIQVQAGEEKFKDIMKLIEKEVSHLQHIEMKYKTRAWTVQVKE